MFKKAVDAKSQQRLSGADRKKLKRTIRDRFPNVSDADIDILLPPKVEITVSKYPNRVLVYGIEGEYPMFFAGDGRGSEIFPTVACLSNQKQASISRYLTTPTRVLSVALNKLIMN